MLDWLKSLSGPDIATYVGVIIGLVGLVYAGTKIVNRNSQKQKIKNGTGIQVGGNLTIGSVDESKSNR
ncbi:hypothetical protein ABMX92_21710 [Vibrio vulnificus]|uniref:hypothetical protein n=1 Tax=Vibrio vulnificus TaxID=672 RepID=UPI004059AD07|nr:hypothetical protein [Vibrio vulnificus]EIU7554638.1 hypothetical protein [Vibrio vulnificus]